LRRAPALLLAVALAACGRVADSPARSDWAQWPAGDPGEVSAVDVAANGHVLVLHRPHRPWAEPFPDSPIAANVVAEFDGGGRLVGEWGGGDTVMPHGLSVAPDGSVWITDAQREQILHFDRTGKLLGATGERGRAGSDLAHFGRPTDIAFAGKRTFVSDGYKNSRVVDLGPPPRQWGVAGDGEAGFRVPHSIAVTGGGIIVADRENSRVKVMDGEGKVRRILATPGHPYAAKPLDDGRILILEGRDGQDREGAVLRLFTGEGKELGSRDIAPKQGKTRGHDLAIAPDGTIYVADVAGHRLLVTSLAELTGNN
jgi:DNA-binding beta-propeller fold protein YncE